MTVKGGNTHVEVALCYMQTFSNYFLISRTLHSTAKRKNKFHLSQ